MSLPRITDYLSLSTFFPSLNCYSLGMARLSNSGAGNRHVRKAAPIRPAAPSVSLGAHTKCAASLRCAVVVALRCTLLGAGGLIWLGGGTFAATLYVWQGSPSPMAPFNSWATAAPSLQQAIDAAQPGDTVLATNGVYATGA